MRKELGKNNKKRLTFIGTVEKFGSKPNWHGFPEKTVLFKNVRFAENDKVATDHIWFTVGKTIESLNLSEGDIVQFDARVGEYIKGYVNFRECIDDRIINYKLNRPTKFIINKKS